MTITFQKIKDWVRKSVDSLPYNIGSNLLKIYVRMIGRRKKVFSEKREAKKITHGVQNGDIRKALIVYDIKVSPPTYGDFFYMVMLARYFVSQGLYVSFIIIDDGFRKDWVELDDITKIHRKKDYVQMVEILLDHPELFEIKVVNWLQFQKKLSKYDSDKYFIPYRNSVLSRSYVYGHAFTLLNYLCSQLDSEQLERFLLSRKEFVEKEKFEEPEDNYITYHCRFSRKKTSLERNTKDEEFLGICKELQSLYPGYKIMVVSDDVGCEYFKTLSIKNKIDCIFSKEFSQSFWGDVALILGGYYHFALRGGGIDMIPLFSKNAYELYISLINETPWNTKQLTSWSFPLQIYTEIKWSKKLYLPSGKINLN